MQFRIFSVPASGDSTAEEELNHFLRANCVVSVSKELSTVAGSKKEKAPAVALKSEGGRFRRRRRR